VPKFVDGAGTPGRPVLGSTGLKAFGMLVTFGIESVRPDRTEAGPSGVEIIVAGSAKSN
jgi:hypothetical protein